MHKDTLSRNIRALIDRGVSLYVEEDELYIDAPEGIITEADILMVSSRKVEIIQFLNEGKEKIDQISPYANLRRVEVREYYPTSSQQRRLYALQQFDPSNRIYNLSSSYIFHKKVDLERLQRAVDAVINRHESLRTSFEVINGEVVQFVHDKVSFSIQYERIVDEQEGEIVDSFMRSFDLSEAPLLRMKLLRKPNGESILLTDMHHIISDGVSRIVFIRDFAKAFRGENLEPLTLQYRDYAVWQQEGAGRELIEQQGEYWLTQYKEEVSVLNLPTDFPRSPIRDWSGASLYYYLDEELTSALKRYCREKEVTLYMAMLACYNILLSRYSGQEDIIVGTVVAGRDGFGLEDLIGMFVNTLALRSQPVHSKCFEAYLQEFKTICLNAFGNQQYPFEDLIEEVDSQRDSSRNPLFDTVFVVQNINQTSTIDDLGPIRPYGLERSTAVFDLIVAVSETEKTIGLDLQYATSLFKEVTIKRIAVHLERLLGQMVKNPEVALKELELVNETERARFLNEYNATWMEYPRNASLVELFQAQVSKTPDALALAYGGESLSYAELDRLSDALAFELIETYGVVKSEVIALCLDRGIEIVIGILGVWKSGCAYVPLDPDYPSDRFSYILSDTGAKIILTQSHYLTRSFGEGIMPIGLDDSERLKFSEKSPDVMLCSENPAYVIYTSGTTGRPKGVLVEHGCVINFLWGLNEYAYPDETIERVAWLAPYTFDPSIQQIFGALLRGHSVHVTSTEERNDGEKLLAFYVREKITISDGTPGHLRMLNAVEDFDRKSLSLKRLVIGGDAFPWALAQEFLSGFDPSDSLELINVYGPTECCINATWQRVDLTRKTSELVPIGSLMGNYRAYVQDQMGHLCPIGIPGELLIGGKSVSRGYLNNPELTDENYLQDNYRRDGRVYLTGDRVRWNDNCELEFLGRLDNQVKIRGYRIELAEIEGALREHPVVDDTVVMAKGDLSEGLELVAYVVQANLANLPNGLKVNHLGNSGETDLLYKEVFESRTYLKHGINLPTNAVVFDVGANMGFSSLFFHQECPGVKIYAFEPMEPTYRVLVRNIKLYGLNVKAFNIGLSNRSGSAEFTFYPKMTGTSGLYGDQEELEAIAFQYVKNQDGEYAEVTAELVSDRVRSENRIGQLKRLSEVIEEEGVERIDLLKLDVEKSEWDVLESIEPMHWPLIQQLVIEAHDSGGRIEKIRALLQQKGYEVEMEEESLLAGTGMYNIYAKRPKEKVSVVAPNQDGLEILLATLDSSRLNPENLRTYLVSRLPEYMVPSGFFLLEEFPMTANGKVDRKVLLELDDSLHVKDKYVAPRNEAEEILAKIWQDSLDIEKVGIHDDFFALGGHSLKAVRAVAKIRKEFEVDLSLNDLFEAATIAEIIPIIDIRNRMIPIGIKPVDRRNYYTVSSQQKRLYALQQFDLSSRTYNLPSAYILDEKIDLKRFQFAVDAVIDRHESLRTSFEMLEGKLVQVVHEKVFCHVELEEVNGEEVERCISEFVRSFDLSKAPLLRVKVLRKRDGESILLIDMHHIVSDGTSSVILMKDFARIFAGQELEPLSLHYRDYAVWQQEGRGRKILESQGKYWLNQYIGEVPVLEMPTDFVRPKVRDFKGKSLRFELGEEMTLALRELCLNKGVTLYMLLFACYNVMLSRYSGKDDIIIGTIVAGRDVSGLDDMVGILINSLAIRSRPNRSKPFSFYLEEVKQQCLNAFENQQYPLDELIDGIGLPYEVSRNPLFDAIFLLQNFEVPSELNIDGFVRPYSTNHAAAKCDLTLYAWESGNRIGFNFEYATSLFKERTVRGFAASFKRLITEVVLHTDSTISNLRLFDNVQVIESIPSLHADCGLFEASYHQERMLFIDDFEKGSLYPQSPVYHNAILLLDINCILNKDTFSNAVRKLIKRHSALRTRFAICDGKYRQEIDPFGACSVRSTCNYSRDAALNEALLFGNEPFSLLEGPLFRVASIAYSEERSILSMVAHHAIVDWASLKILCAELLEFYDLSLSGRDSRLMAPPLQYVDFSSWQRSAVDGKFQEAWLHWQKKLSGDSLPILQFPTDKSREAIHVYHAARFEFMIERELKGRLEVFSNEEGVDVSTVFLAAFKVLLMDHSKQEEAIIGVSHHNRDSNESSGIIGPIANLLPVRTRLPRDLSFADAVQVVARALEECEHYHYYPFDEIVSCVRPRKDMSRTALFDVLFQYESESPLVHCDVNWDFEEVETNLGWGKYDVNLMLCPRGEVVHGYLVYNADYFEAERISRLIDSYKVTLEAAMSEPNSILGSRVCISDKERKILESWSGDEVCANVDASSTLHGLFERTCDQFADKVALSFYGEGMESKSWTYSELEKRANRLAWSLNSLFGIESKIIVGVYLEKTCDFVVAILAILKAGGAYLTLDPAHPVDRLEWICRDSGISLLLTSSDLELSFEFEGEVLFVNREECYGSRETRIPGVVFSSDLAYIIYTSGSTGRPKGVMVEHGNVVQLLESCAFEYRFDESEVWTMFHSQAFDFSVWEIWGAFRFGGRLVMVPHWTARDPEKFKDLLLSERVSVLSQTPAALEQLADALDEEELIQLKSHLNYIVCGGDRLDFQSLGRWISTELDSTRVINMYGITETTVHVTFYEVVASDLEANQGSVVGKPLKSAKVYILNKDRKMEPIGISGEIFVGGRLVSRGYLNRPELTGSRFLESPFEPGNTIYRTGDLARWNVSGNLEYLGRNDDQIQLRGFRIEPGEVESVLSWIDGICETVVVSRVVNGETALVAYYTSDLEIDTSSLRGDLRHSLPDYMVPSYFVRLEKVPLTSNGKVDRKGLPEVDENLLSVIEYVAPRNDIEKVLVNIWQDVLKVEKVGINDDFFEMGGHSLKAVSAVSKIRKILEVDLSIKELFELPTINELAVAISSNASLAYQTIPRVKKQEFYPVSSQQRRLYIMSQMSPKSVEFHIPYRSRIIGEFDFIKLQSAFQTVIERHEALRTNFVLMDNNVVQRVSDNIRFEIGYEENDKSTLEQLNFEFTKPFNIQSDLLIRAKVIKRSDRENWLFVDIHHIISDGISSSILINDIICNLEGIPLRPLNLQYKDYAVWESGLLKSGGYDREILYWKNQLAGASAIVELPSDRPRKVNRSLNGGSYTYSIPESLSASIIKLSREKNCTVFMSLICAFNIFLYRFTGQEDISLCTDSANRFRPELEGVVGFFINQLVLRSKIEGYRSFDELLSQVRKNVIDANSNQILPFDLLIEELQPVREPGYVPYGEVMFSYQELPKRDDPKSTIRFELFGNEVKVSKRSLSVVFREENKRLVGTWTYSSDLFDSETIIGLSRDYEILWEEIVRDGTTAIEDLNFEHSASKKIQNVHKDKKRSLKSDNLRKTKRKLISS